MPEAKRPPKVIRDRDIFAYFWRASSVHRRSLLLALFFPLGGLCVSTFIPFYTGKLLAALGTDVSHAWHWLPFLAAVGLFGALANRIGSVNLFEHQARVMAELQTRALNTLLRHSSNFHNNRVAGKLVSDAIEFPLGYAQIANSLVVQLLPLTLALVVGITLVSIRSWELGLVLLGMVSVVVGGALYHSTVRRPLRKKRKEVTKKVTSHLADVIVNNQTVKTFAREDSELAQHRELNCSLLELRIKDWREGATSGNNRLFGLVIFQLLFALLIIQLVKREPALLATGIFAFSYSVTLSNNLFTINSLIRTVEDGLLQADPIMESLAEEVEIVDKPNATKLVVSKGQIDFKNVQFAYEETTSTESVFAGLNLQVKPGEKVGLVGPSGGGKTTFTRLLLRFNDIQGGEILIDGQNIADVTQESLRRAIAYVPQEPLMFHRSVLENIAYGQPGATKAMVIAAAKKANAHDFITALPKGYDTLVGERGVKLSGGQRQRVAIARAILKDAPILILDEATSALDSESEVLIQGALRELMQHKTALVIAHRLSTIQKMDRIIVLNGGKIVEQGTHAELLKQKGLYARLWKHQSGGFIET